MYDIIIVGAGPAGATLARMLDNTFKVLVIDKRNFNDDNRRIRKCCGGLLAPDAQKILGHLGLGIPKDVLVGPQLFAVKTLDFDNHIERFYQRHYININREKFDTWLVNKIPNHVTQVYGAQYKNYKVLGHNRIEVTYTKNNQIHKARTKYLVGADGGFSIVRRQLGLGEGLQRYASVQEWYEVDNPMPYFTTIFDREVTDFYTWTIPKENALLIGTAIPMKDEVNKRFERLKEKLRTRGFPMDKRIRREGAYIIRPTKATGISYGKEHVFLIGEAAGLISPSSAEGFSYGIRSALKLAKAFNRLGNQISIRAYKKACSDLSYNIRIKNLKSPVMYHPALRKAVMGSKILSMKINESH